MIDTNSSVGAFTGQLDEVAEAFSIMFLMNCSMLLCLFFFAASFSPSYFSKLWVRLHVFADKDFNTPSEDSLLSLMVEQGLEMGRSVSE